jgi:hypothetical protein
LDILRYSTFEQLARIAAEQTYNSRQDQHADPAAPKRHSASHAATVFYITALPLVSPTHQLSPETFSLTYVY